MQSFTPRLFAWVIILGLVPQLNKAASACSASAGQACKDGSTTLAGGGACDPECSRFSVALGQFVCRGNDHAFTGPGCVNKSQVPIVSPSDVDAVPDATSAEDMVFKNFKLLDTARCLIWPKLAPAVKEFILIQAEKYGPSSSAIAEAKKLGSNQKTEFFLSIEQVSILLAQLMCGATERAGGSDFPFGGDTHPQAFAFGRAMEHWYYSDFQTPRSDTWRRTTLVGYGTFDSDSPVPNSSSTVQTGSDLTITSGCDSGGVADSSIGDSQTMTVIFAGHYVGGWMWGWHNSNAHGAQEEKFGTLIPEMMLATEPLRKMGAGLLSTGGEDPWVPEAGWYIIGAGSYVKGKGYPRWGSERVPIDDDTDYFSVGTGRKIRRRGIVAIMAKPCNDRGGCGSNSADLQYRCYNRQVEDRDLEPAPRANLWGIAAGAFDFVNWPSKTRQLLEDEHVAANWVLQAGGWGSGAFGCGTLYGGLVQALAAKKGGWKRMRMCWAGRGDPRPTMASKLGYSFDPDGGQPLMFGENVNDFANGKAIMGDHNFGDMANQLHTTINQNLKPWTCGTVKCDRWNNHEGTCLSSIVSCYYDRNCKWHRNEREDLRDFVSNPKGAPGCNPDCSSTAGICTELDIPGHSPPHSPTERTPDGQRPSGPEWPGILFLFGGASVAAGIVLICVAGRKKRRLLPHQDMTPISQTDTDDA